MKVTIKEVAKLSGVSPSTVSRVISDNPRISEKTKKTVREAMKKLNYHPNAIARSLVNRNTKTIGIVMPQSAEMAFLNPFFPQALRGIAAAAHEQEYCLLLTTGSNEKEQLVSMEGILNGGRVDGVIIMYSSAENEALNLVKELNIPSVIIGKPLNDSEALYVDNDNVEATYNVTFELIKNGHKKIGFLCGPLKFVVSIDRLEGYRECILDNGLKFTKKYVRESNFTKEDGYTKMKSMITQNDRPTALIVTDDIMAIGAMEAIKEFNLKIPEDIEVISFNNIPISEFCNPSLTSVDINAYSLGFSSSKLLIHRINNIDLMTNKVIVPTKIIKRRSSKI